MHDYKGRCGAADSGWRVPGGIALAERDVAVRLGAMSVVAMGLLVLAGIGVLVCWPGAPGSDSWWAGPGRRSSRQGRRRQVLGDSVTVLGLLGAVIAQFVLAGAPGVAGAVTLVIGLLVVALLVWVFARRYVRARRVCAGEASSPAVD